ncbi:MAG: damage-inducible protein CinA [Planctomycetaceae bacterium]|nr:damage-inducible protein CinA [Planctomycetaceae bacterium]
MYAEIIAIGSELTSGEKLDTNSQWLSLQLADLGIPVLFHTTVADNVDANLQALQLAVERTDVVLITGGLGPTLDDLTRDVLAHLAGVPLEIDATSLADLEQFFRGRGREMPERNRIQAMFPQGATPLPNPIGTAPGIWMAFARPDRSPCLIAAMPGVPSEMHLMFHEQVRPRLPGGARVIRRARLNCFGLGESATEELLGDLTARGRDPEVGITAHDATITLRIVAQGATESECEAKIAAVTAAAHERLGDHIFGREDEKLEDVILQRLWQRGETLATVEIATRAQLASRCADATARHQEQSMAAATLDESSPFLGGLVLTEATAPITAIAHDRQTHTHADYVLAIGPEHWTEVGGRRQSSIDIALRSNDGVESSTLTWNGNPAIRLSRTTKTALDLLRRKLLESGTDVP